MAENAETLTTEISNLIGPPKGYGHRRYINDDAKSLIRRWLIANGVSEKRAYFAGDEALSHAWDRGQSYILKMKEEEPRRQFKGGGRGVKGIKLDGFNGDDDVVQDLLGKPQENDQIIDLDKKIEPIVNRIVDLKLKSSRIQLDDSAKAEIQLIAKLTAKTAAEAAIAASLPRRVEIVDAKTNITTDLGLQHEKFDTLLRLLSARDHKGQRLNIWLTGPTGSGKTSAAEFATEALEQTFESYTKTDSGEWEIRNANGTLADLNGLSHDGPFGADSSLDADYKIVGFKDANGRFHWTTFLRIFVYGGIYVADEIDNWMPSALVALNAALANGWISTPIGILRRHKDACIIACANTWGLGATNEYVGRAKLDAATINRFPTKLDWPIDEKLERAVAANLGGDLGLKWCNLIQQARQKAKSQGLQIIISPRNTFDGIALLKTGFSCSEVINMNFAAGLRPEHLEALNIKSLVFF